METVSVDAVRDGTATWHASRLFFFFQIYHGIMTARNCFQSAICRISRDIELSNGARPGAFHVPRAMCCSV